MKRLTMKDENGCFLTDKTATVTWNSLIGKNRYRGEAVDRLAAYEDTGLEPEEIAKIREDVENGYLKSTARRYGISVDRLRELAEADREGRCVVLPCKRDDVLWTFHTYPSERVYSFHVTDLSTLNGRTMLNTDIMGVVDARDVGKTVFLTRAEAEAALAKIATNCD